MLWKNILTICGLILEISGAWWLFHGEIKSQAAFVKYQASGEGARSFELELKNQPWYRRFVMCLVLKRASRDPLDMNPPPLIEAIPDSAGGFGLIFLGFLLQAVVAVWSMFADRS